MDLSLIKIFFLLLLLISFLDLSLAKKCFFGVGKVQVHIINKLPANSPQLKLHCASKDDDFGDHWLAIDGDFNWAFCDSIIIETLYFCHFWWEANDKAFVVYNNVDYCLKNQMAYNYLKYCKWEVRQDGFYLEQYNKTDGSYTMHYYIGWS